MTDFLQGKEIVSLLGAARPGVWTGTVLARVSEWALDHPEDTKEECAEWLKKEHAAGRIETGSAPEGAGKAPPTKKAKVANATS